jgi:hypothetical protein
MLLLIYAIIAFFIIYLALKLVFFVLGVGWDILGAIFGNGIVQSLILWVFIIPTGVLIVAMVLQGVFTGEIK